MQYWSQTESAIPNQSEETLAAIAFARDVASNVAQNVTISSPKQANVSQVFGTGSSGAANIISNNFNLVLDIITTGTVGVTDRIIPNGLYPTEVAGYNEAANLVLLNKDFIAAEVIAFVNQTYDGFFANANNFLIPEEAANTCSRDVGFILESTVFDLVHGGNRQSIQSGVYYYTYNANQTQINDQIVQTGQSYTFISNLINEILNGDGGAIYQTDISANLEIGSLATDTEKTKAYQSVGLIKNIITNGPSSAQAKTPISISTRSNDANAINAAEVILSNRDYIKAETIAYVNTILWDPPYQTLVSQNTIAAPAATSAEANLVLENISLIKNIITNGPTVAPAKIPIYYNTDATTNVSNAAKIILANKDYIKAETIAYINKELFDPPYQDTVRQNTTAAPAATSAETAEILQDINLITNIIENGPTVAEPKAPIYYTPSTDPNVINATKIILANREYIVAETVAFVNQNWANISNGTVQFFTVANATPLVANTSTVTLLETINDITFLPNITVSFHQPSYISASGHTFEYVGSGNELATALPYAGGFPVQANEVLQSAGGQVYFTSTDQQGDFRIGSELLFNRVDGTISGETFNKSLFAVMTPYILAIEG